jgi:DNA-binding response OmpR family regulator
MEPGRFNAVSFPLPGKNAACTLQIHFYGNFACWLKAIVYYMNNRILIYDDDKDILLVTATILELKGYIVTGREHCRTLDEDLISFQPNVILMDNWLPDIGGVKAIQYIKGHHSFKTIPVIFFSANSSVEELAREAGADYMLKKPFEIAGLQQLIEAAIANAPTGRLN